MTFDARHPHAAAGDRTPNGFCKVDVRLGCCNCGEPTPWLSTLDRLFVCSEECYGEYLRATSTYYRQLAVR